MTTTRHPETEPTDSATTLPAALIEDLTAHKTAALRIEVARQPVIAFALVVHGLATSVFYRSAVDVLDLSLTTRSLRPSIKDHDNCPAILALKEEHERVKALLPPDHAGLWDWCYSTPQDVLMDVLAVAAAHGIDAVQSKADANHGARAHGEAVAAALKLDMVQWYRPTAEGYFGRISKAAILADLQAARQAAPAPAWLKLKKGELAACAERETAARGWLPVPLAPAMQVAA